MRFLDSNILIYAADETQSDKYERACEVAVQPEWTQLAIDIKSRYNLQFYDSLLLAAAEANGCSEFWSEDLNDGQMYCGMKAVNPFKEFGKNKKGEKQ